LLVPIRIGLVTYLNWRKSSAWWCRPDSRPVVLPGDPVPAASLEPLEPSAGWTCP